MSVIEDNANKLKDIVMSDIEKNANIVFDGILNNQERNKIPESLFVNYFLPCILGVIKNDKWVIEWISIAGTPMSELDIYDDSTGEILFTVPSLLNTNNLITHNTNTDLNDIFNRYEQINNNIPIQGLSFLVKALNGKNKELLKDFTLKDSDKKWEEILVRYGLISKEEVTNNNSNESDIFEY